MDQVICTQDLPGERDWIQSKFPNHVNYQSEYSGLWPDSTFSPDSDSNFIWELPVDSAVNLDDQSYPKSLSLYRPSAGYVDQRWCQTQHLLTDCEFSNGPRKKLAQVVSFGRTGTVFLESLLYGYLGYQELSPHAFIGIPHINAKVIDLCEQHRPDIFLVYRKNHWDRMTSLWIAEANGIVDSQGKLAYLHGKMIDRWDKLNTITVSEDQVHDSLVGYAGQWNACCNLRAQFPDLNFFVIEFFDLIKIKKENLDSKLSYNKQELISNYHQAKSMFDSLYQTKFDTYQANILKHLAKMNCRFLDETFHLDPYFSSQLM